MQCNQVVQGSLAGEALTLPRTSLASRRSGNTLGQGKADLLYIHTWQFDSVPEQIKVTHCLSCRPLVWPKRFPGLLHPTTHHVQTNTPAIGLRTKAFYPFYDVP